MKPGWEGTELKLDGRKEIIALQPLHSFIFLHRLQFTQLLKHSPNSVTHHVHFIQLHCDQILSDGIATCWPSYPLVSTLT